MFIHKFCGNAVSTSAWTESQLRGEVVVEVEEQKRKDGWYIELEICIKVFIYETKWMAR